MVRPGWFSSFGRGKTEVINLTYFVVAGLGLAVGGQERGSAMAEWVGIVMLTLGLLGINVSYISLFARAQPRPDEARDSHHDHNRRV
jgi:hypothetical protein